MTGFGDKNSVDVIKLKGDISERSNILASSSQVEVIRTLMIQTGKALEDTETGAIHMPRESSEENSTLQHCS